MTHLNFSSIILILLPTIIPLYYLRNVVNQTEYNYVFNIFIYVDSFKYFCYLSRFFLQLLKDPKINKHIIVNLKSHD